jgi:protease-4
VIQAMIDDSFNWFVDLVADRRNLPHQEALQLADGRIFTGRQALKLKLIDELGGDDEIRAFLDSRKVGRELDVIDWKAPSTSLPFGLGSAAAVWLKSLGYEAFPYLGSLEKLGHDKLFLDGLVSVWQVGGD